MVSLNTSVLLVALASVGNVEILEFTSASCGPCRMMQPTIQRLSLREHPFDKSTSTATSNWPLSIG